MTTARYHVRDVFTLPGWLSLSRVGLAICFPFVQSQTWLALGVVAAAAISDVLDGYLARLLGQSTPTGAALDPITDKVFAISVMGTLVIAGRLSIPWALLLHLRELGELPLMMWLAVSPRVREVRAAQLGANVLGKLATTLQFGALIAILFAAPTATWWIIATAIIGALAASSYWARVLATLRSGHPENPIIVYWPSRTVRTDRE